MVIDLEGHLKHTLTCASPISHCLWLCAEGSKEPQSLSEAAHEALYSMEEFNTSTLAALKLHFAPMLLMWLQGSKEPQPMPEAAKEALNSKEEFNASIPKRH